jgi:hypothetical protein
MPLNDLTEQAVQCDGKPAYFFFKARLYLNVGKLLHLVLGRNSSDITQPVNNYASLAHVYVTANCRHALHYINVIPQHRQTDRQTINMYAVDNTLISSTINNMQIKRLLMLTASKAKSNSH